MQPTPDSEGRSPPKSAARRIWTLLWVVLAILHVTQAIWLSGGTAYPGDLTDGRFNQLVLEHGYLSLRGFYHWSSPAQFYPTAGILGYSDTHAGTLPIYASLRLIGCSMEQAWQGWFVVVAACNALAALRLFRVLGISPWLRGPLVFAAVSSVLMVWIAGTHMQMLPVFPGLLAWAELVRWCDQRRFRHLLAAGGVCAWQFATSPYLAFFWAVLTVAIAAVLALSRRGEGRAETPPSPRGLSRPSWAGALVVAIAGGGAAMAVAAIYLTGVRSEAVRSTAEVLNLAPDWRSWFTAPPVHAFYPPGWFGRHTDLGEQAWFAGFMPWLALGAALALGWNRRRSASGAWMLALAGGAVATMLFFTKWGAPGVGAWVAVVNQFPVLRAFRASGRIAVLLQIVEVAAAGVVLTTWAAAVRPSWRFLPVLLAGLLAIEGLGAHQPATFLAVARARSDAMVAAWRRAGDHPVLAFAFGYTNQSETLFQLDAWSAALRLKRATLNGYTGGIPGTHQGFIWNPTVENARQLIAYLGLPIDRVSIVEGFSSDAEAALGIEHYAGRPTSQLTGFGLQPFAWQLYSPPELWVVNSTAMYQFTPAAEVRFHVPDGAKLITFLQAMRSGSYSGGGHSDGVGVTWAMQWPDGHETTISHEYFNPRDRAEHRGVVPRELTLPAGIRRVLILRTDAGPAGDSAWDWPLFGNLESK